MVWFLVKNIQEELEEIDQIFSIAIHVHPSHPHPKMLSTSLLFTSRVVVNKMEPLF